MQKAPETKGSKQLIAVIDDDSSFLRSIGRMLRIAGYSVNAYTSAGEFLKSVPSHIPQCLVVDMHMPEMTGIELQERLIAEGLCVPSILVTAHDTAQTREQARKRGFSALLLKPFDGEILLDAIRILASQDATHCGTTNLFP